MAAKSRNFRSYYYDKVGFRGVEEKKSLEMILGEKPTDKTKLSKFCLMFTLPSIYREYVWKILLDVLPLNPGSYDSVTFQREQQYMELYHALEIMRKIDNETSKSLIFTQMFLMDEGMLLYDWEQQLRDPEIQNLNYLASAFISIGSSDANKYWLFRNFVHFQRKFTNSFKMLEEQFENILKKEDLELYKHLNKIHALKTLPLGKWFHAYFADILHHRSLEKLWDKVIGGSCKVLPIVAVALLVMSRRELLQIYEADLILKRLQKITEDTSDVVVTRALDLCPNVL